MTQIAIVTGSSSGIGLETSLVLARNGFYTYAIMRNLDKSNSVINKAKEELLPLQVTHVSNSSRVHQIFELFPERSVFKQEEEHILAVSASRRFSDLMMYKQEGGNRAVTKEEEYKEKQKRKILIVDDDPDTTLIFKKTLMDEGFEQVDTVNDPLLALNNFKAGSYDLLIIDIVMPQMDGFRLYEEIRKIDNQIKICFYHRIRGKLSSFESCISRCHYH